MDVIDSKILRSLMIDGHMTNARLAKVAGLSESATLERVRRLEATGVLKGYTALVEPSSVGRGLEVFMTFTLKNQNLKDVRRFEEAMADTDEVLSCAQALGRFEFVAPVAVRAMAAARR